MKILLKSRQHLRSAGRWDIDFHLPAEGIQRFPNELLRRVDQIADLIKDKRDPTKEREKAFHYIDISSIDIAKGVVANPQYLEGREAPSRARKVVRAFDLVVSTCRPTRGAIAVVPVKFHNQIASTGFSIVRAHEDVNPFYLQFAFRFPSTLEQFRKWSTGSSYPAILDSDVKKTIVPIPPPELQDVIASKIVAASHERARVIRAANKNWNKTLGEITASLGGAELNGSTVTVEEEELDVFLLADIREKLKELPPTSTGNNANGNDKRQAAIWT